MKIIIIILLTFFSLQPNDVGISLDDIEEEISLDSIEEEVNLDSLGSMDSIGEEISLDSVESGSDKPTPEKIIMKLHPARKKIAKIQKFLDNNPRTAKTIMTLPLGLILILLFLNFKTGIKNK